MGKQIERSNLVRGAGFKDLVTLSDATDKELQNIAEQAGTAQLEVFTEMPSDSEGRTGDRALFVDDTGQLGTRGARYKLYRFEDGWYRESALTKLR